MYVCVYVSLRCLEVGEHEVGQLAGLHDLLGRRGGGATLVLGDEGSSLALAAVPNGHLCACLGQIGRHPLAHDACGRVGSKSSSSEKTHSFVCQLAAEDRSTQAEGLKTKLVLLYCCWYQYLYSKPSACVRAAVVLVNDNSSSSAAYVCMSGVYCCSLYRTTEQREGRIRVLQQVVTRPHVSLVHCIREYMHGSLGQEFRCAGQQ